VKDGNIDGITDLRDESDRRGMRIVIELRCRHRARCYFKQTLINILSCKVPSA
jgi:DNA gyrase/topoisomerase IV subunit A